jgi:hypothetical protein
LHIGNIILPIYALYLGSVFLPCRTVIIWFQV